MNAFDLLMHGQRKQQHGKRKQAAAGISGKGRHVRQRTEGLVAAEQQKAAAATTAAAADEEEAHPTGFMVPPPAAVPAKASGACGNHLNDGSKQLVADTRTAPASQHAARQQSAPATSAACMQSSNDGGSMHAQLDAFRSAFARRSTFPVRQEWDKLLVYDLEATCNRDRTIAPIEIIELSCVVVDVGTQSIQCEYQAYVRPTEHPQLDPFCIELTGITQQQVDAGEPLAVVLQQHHAWLQQQGLLESRLRCVAVTWTEWDLKIAMCTECGWRNLQRQPYLCSWVDLKAAYKRKYKRSDNLKNAVAVAGLAWEGRAHSGLDDARNTARLAIRLMQSVKLRLTDQYEEGPLSSNPQGQGTKALQHAGSSQLSDSGSGLAAAASAAAAATAVAAAQQGEPGSGTAAGKQLHQALLTPKQQVKARVQVYDSAGRWTGMCYCGVKAKVRVTKKPGVHHGRQFYSCGKWTINRQHLACSFFLWGEDVPAGSSVPPPRTAPWT